LGTLVQIYGFILKIVSPAYEHPMLVAGQFARMSLPPIPRTQLVSQYIYSPQFEKYMIAARRKRSHRNFILIPPKSGLFAVDIKHNN